MAAVTLTSETCGVQYMYVHAPLSRNV